MAALKSYTPTDYLRGSKKVGGNYTAWDTYGQGTPDFGHQKGPGDPYHEVQKKVKPLPSWAKPPAQIPWAPGVDILGQGNTAQNNLNSARGGIVARAADDPRIEAIRRRLRGL